MAHSWLRNELHNCYDKYSNDNLLLRHIDTLTKSSIKIDKLDLPTFYWLPKLHKNPYKSRFISNSSHCSTTILSKHITSALTAVKEHVIKYSETAFSNSNVNYFWSIKNSSEVIEKLRLRNFQGSQVSSFDFSTLYTSLPHDLIKAKVLSLVKWCFDRESKTYLCTSDKAGFFSNKKYDSFACWTCTELCEAFTFLMENIYVQFDGMVYQHIVGIPMGTNCAPLIADLFLYCYERDFMSNIQKSKRFDLIDKSKDTLDILTIYSPLITLHLLNIFPIYIQENCNWIKQILPTKKHLSWIYISKLLVTIFTPACTTNAMTLDFLLLISPDWVVMFLDSHHTVFTFRS